MLFYEDREIENERVELTDKDSLYFLAPMQRSGCVPSSLKASGRRRLFDSGSNIREGTGPCARAIMPRWTWGG
jgi:hypothetical protein